MSLALSSTVVLVWWQSWVHSGQLCLPRGQWDGVERPVPGMQARSFRWNHRQLHHPVHHLHVCIRRMQYSRDSSQEHSVPHVIASIVNQVFKHPFKFGDIKRNPESVIKNLTESFISLRFILQKKMYFVGRDRSGLTRRVLPCIKSSPMCALKAVLSYCWALIARLNTTTWNHEH